MLEDYFQGLCLNNEEFITCRSTTQPSVELNKNDIPAKIKQLKELFDGGSLTQEEFDTKKKELLDKM